MSYVPKFSWHVANVDATVPWTHTGDTDWTAITGGSTGSVQFPAGEYRILLYGELKTSNATAEARFRIYDVTGATAYCAAHTDQTVDGECRMVGTDITLAGGANEFRIEGKIDNLAQTITVNKATLSIERLS